MLVEGTAYSRSVEACSHCFRGSLSWQSEDRSGTGEQEAGEAAASGWRVGSFAGSRVGLEAFLPWDSPDPDGKT